MADALIEAGPGSLAPDAQTVGRQIPPAIRVPSSRSLPLWIEGDGRRTPLAAASGQLAAPRGTPALLGFESLFERRIAGNGVLTEKVCGKMPGGDENHDTRGFVLD